jgi:hypothetical protein
MTLQPEDISQQSRKRFARLRVDEEVDPRSESDDAAAFGRHPVSDHPLGAQSSPIGVMTRRHDATVVRQDTRLQRAVSTVERLRPGAAASQGRT